ncbi:hypothetical protein [uncultured Sphingomonas sp.]|uniref:hypothetical protein n=1 Tax=uncultured Sphingomonas sp. TaxID=158754 RepID=UPI00262D8D90|nr:hypothetical protein [uncultured Sphingomonas sp.]
MEHPRTTSARDHDDSAIIDAADRSPEGIGHAGGRLATDVGTQNDLTREVDDPEAHDRVTKEDAIANDTAYRSDRRGGNE